MDDPAKLYAAIDAMRAQGLNSVGVIDGLIGSYCPIVAENTSLSLNGPRLGLRAELHPPLKQGRIVARQIEADQVGRERKDDDEEPALPVRKRARGDEDKDGNDNQPND